MPALSPASFQMLPKGRAALVLVGHGSTTNLDSSAPTFAHADALRSRGIFAEVHCAFWKEEPSLREIVRMIDAEEIYVVPNFISEGYFTNKIIPRELGVTGITTHLGAKTIYYCEPVGNDPRIVDLLLARAREVAPSVPASETSLVIVGHGTGLNENSAVATKRQVQLISDRGIYAQVIAAYMEEEPKVEHWDALTNHPFVVVVPFFISDGLHSYEDIPVLLGIAEQSPGAASQQEIFRRNPHLLRGRTLFYGSSIGTSPMIADIILDTVARFDAQRREALSP
jgi:sirohydrochlorin cobaltochelatase